MIHSTQMLRKIFAFLVSSVVCMSAWRCAPSETQSFPLPMILSCSLHLMHVMNTTCEHLGPLNQSRCYIESSHQEIGSRCAFSHIGQGLRRCCPRCSSRPPHVGDSSTSLHMEQTINWVIHSLHGTCSFFVTMVEAI